MAVFHANAHNTRMILNRFTFLFERVGLAWIITFVLNTFLRWTLFPHRRDFSKKYASNNETHGLSAFSGRRAYFWGSITNRIIFSHNFNMELVWVNVISLDFLYKLTDSFAPPQLELFSQLVCTPTISCLQIQRLIFLKNRSKTATGELMWMGSVRRRLQTFCTTMKMTAHYIRT